jgi:hypothetical protein
MLKNSLEFISKASRFIIILLIPTIIVLISLVVVINSGLSGAIPILFLYSMSIIFIVLIFGKSLATYLRYQSDF